MKNGLIGILLAISSSAMASGVQTAEFYQLDGWQGEYPSGYEIINEIEVSSVLAPLNPMADQSCTLKAQSVIHPWAKKTVSEFLTLSPVSRYKAAKDFELGEVKVKAGAPIAQLAYLAEGICLMEVGGVEVEDSCFGSPESEDRAILISESPFANRTFFKTACLEGYSAWIDSQELQNLLLEEVPNVKSAEIIEYGEVKEP